MIDLATFAFRGEAAMEVTMLFAVNRGVLSAPARLAMAAVLAVTVLGCDDGATGGSPSRTGPDGAALEDGGQCVSLFPAGESSLTAAPPVQAIAFDFATGNSAVEVIIPTAIPFIFQSVNGPGDATLILRFTSLFVTVWFDAIAPYHATAVGVFSDLGRRPASESTDNTQLNTAMFYASYRMMSRTWPQHQATWDAMMESVGLDPDDDHEGTGDAIGIGNAAGNAVMDVKDHDGFNVLGDEGGDISAQRPYSDYTGYAPRNTAYEIRDPRRWQPRLNTSPYGIARVQHFVTPQYALTLPYTYDDPQDFGVPPPLKSYKIGPHGKKNYKAQVDAVLAASANLTDEQKMYAELFDDKIRSLGFSTIFASLSRGLTLTEFVHHELTVQTAAWDVGIIVWQEKTQWDAVRPFTAVEHVYGDDLVTAWGGPGQGTVQVPANLWKEYLNVADHPEYPSGSSAFCHAHAQASRLYLGDDNLGWTIPTPAGSSVVEPGITPAVVIDLHFDTWTDFATVCGQSRVWGGVHFQDAVDISAPLGTQIGTIAHEFVQAHIDGDV
jgi:hypothetical protein